MTASQQPGVQRSLDTSFVICQFCKSACALTTVDDGWAAPLPGAVLSHSCGQPHYGPDLIIRVQRNIRWGENGPTAGGTRQIINGSLEMFRSRSMWRLSIHRLLHSLKYPGNGWKLYGESEKQGKFDQSCVYLLLIFPCHFRQAPIIQCFPGFWLVRLQVHSTPGPIFLLHLSRWQFLVTLAPVQILDWSGASHATKLFLLGIIEVSEEWDSKRVRRENTAELSASDPL